MNRHGSSKVSGSRSASLRSVDSFLEAKLHRPSAHEDSVDRGRLYDRLDHAVACPLVLVAAPAGFGKTTLIAQWLVTRRLPRATAWVSLDAGDNDPVRLWTHVATAVERAGCRLEFGAATFVARNSGHITAGLLPKLLNAMAAMPDDLVILLDDFHLVREPTCHDQVEFLIAHLPPQAHVVIASRSDPGLRLGRLRASGQLGEVRAVDLAFNADEATALLALQGVQLSDDSLAQLMDRTEGWPAGLYLAALSLAGRADPDEFVREFSGNTRFIGDYLTEEVLGRHTDRLRGFIITMSILDRLSAPLCDFVAETTASAAILRELERSNMFLIPLDEHRRWYRFHSLFATAARSELELEQPNRIAALHARAGAWFREHGHVDDAVRHLLASGKPGDAALLVQASWLAYVDAGRTATVLGWLDALGPPSISSDPAACVTAAWLAALTGDEVGLAGYLEALEEFRDYGPLPDGTRSVESAIAMIQGLFGFGGPIEMASGAQRAVELETDGHSPYYALANLTLAHSAAPALVRVLSSSIHSLAEAESGHPARARELAGFAMEIVDRRGLHASPQASLAFTALGQAQAADGQLTNAMATVEHGLQVRRRNPALSPWPTMHHLLVAARVARDAGELPRARDLLDEAKDLMDRYSDGMGPMRRRLATVQDMLPSPSTPPAGVRRDAAAGAGEPLTGREIDVLRLLQGSLNLGEIAGQLYVSHNTVKTHTRALYRKLGARSRTEAVRIARERLLV
jgi:LuxR family maltose regulon positive regulatory protein